MGSLVTSLPAIFALLAKGGQYAQVLGPALEILGGALAAATPKQQEASAPLDVKWLQLSLKTFGFDPGRIDGKYGEATRKAVAAYQKARKLQVDGWAGPATLAAIVQEQSGS